MEEVERQLQCVESERKKLEAEAKEHHEKINELESNLQKTQVELSTQLEDTKMKVGTFINHIKVMKIIRIIASSCGIGEDPVAVFS